MAETKRPRLALAIPTYCRAEILVANLTRMEDELRRHGIAVYVSDDSPNDETERAIAQFDFVRYRRNTPSLGHDANLISTLIWPVADHVWLLGDSHAVKNEVFSEIIPFLDDRDLIMVNSHAESTGNIRQVEGEEARVLLRKMLWHQSMTGATIYHRRVCDWVKSSGSDFLTKRNFPQLSALLGYATAHEPSVGWFAKPALNSVKKESYWSKRAIPVFVDDWAAVIEAFPLIVPDRHRRQVIRSHSEQTRFFNLATMLELSSSGQFGWSDLFKRHFRQAMHLPIVVLVGILLIPRPLRFRAIQIAKRLRKSLLRKMPSL